nr:alpha/beta hydrolase [Streptomyces sp. NBC_00857]
MLAVDLPGHGRSEGGSGSPGPWSLEATAAAIERALQPYGIPHAVPVGHSLGGMIALQYAVQNTARHGGACPGAVNLDGFWWGRPEQYPDLDRTTVTQGLARIGDKTRSAAGLIAPAEHVEQQALHAGQFGIPYARAEAATRGAVRELPDGRFQTLPLREQALETFDALDALDILALIRRVPCPGRSTRDRPND